MKWIKINKKNLPVDEILAANFKPFTFGYEEKLIGCFHIENNIIICENEHEVLKNCTHYIPLHNFNIA